MLDHDKARAAGRTVGLAFAVWLASLLIAAPAGAAPGNVTVRVVTPNSAGPLISTGFRWLLEEDVTYPVTPCLPTPTTTCPPPDVNDTNVLALNLHRSYSPVISSGAVVSGGTVTITVPETTRRYFVSILPNEGGNCQLAGNCFTMSGHQIGAGQTVVNVPVTSQPVPTAQIFVRAHEDDSPINNTWDDGEAGLGGFTVFIYDMGGQLNTDTFGNPLGTVYEGLASDGTPRVKRLGDGSIHTMTAAEVNDPGRNPYGLEVGEALVKNIAPGKYGVQVVPPYGEDWHQTSTIEGTKGLDAWVKAGEPRFFAEFGPAGHHAEFGFVRPANFARLNGTQTIRGRVTNLRMQRPPEYTFSSGHPLPGCWVGLNDGTATQGLYVTRCAGDSTFSIANVPPGDYQLVVWDDYLDTIWDSRAVTVPASGDVELGDVTVFRWWQSHEHWVFNDLNENGQRDPGEAGIPDQVINLRYRDGSIYSSSTTDTTGYLPFDEIFPFFSWLIAEVDFARFKATGVTVAVDAGGPVQGAEENGAIWPRQSVGHGHLNPQQQSAEEASVVYQNGAATGQRNPDTRTECTNRVMNPECSDSTAPILLEGYNAFLGTTNTFEWGKKAYDPGENGGITGVVQYSTTRAENDPRFAAAETWEPGIPRVQVNLYRGDSLGRILHVDGSTSGPASPPVLADVDNYPFGWQDATGPLGPEDIDRNGNGAFDAGDAIEIAHSDSFDDSPPTGCPGQRATSADPNPTGDPFYLNGRCYDGLRNYNQVRPAVFDGGFAFGRPFTDLQLDSGYYVVEANTPPGYQHQKEEDKNVDFGDTMTISPQALPPVCVGDSRPVPAQLALFPGVDGLYAGQQRPLCDRKLVLVSDAKNTAANFFMFTEVPVTGHIQGFVLNDLANEFDLNSPNFGEKFAPSYIPVSVRDYAGNEVYHTYTDNWGTYNAIVPTSYRINTPMPSGVSPNMLQVCLNSPMMEDPARPGTFRPDPFFNRQYTQFCYTLDFKPGQTTYLDTPVLPIAAFANPANYALDCRYPAGTPIVYSVSAENNTLGGGPFVRSNGSDAQRTLTIASAGTVSVPDPQMTRVDGSNARMITRDYGFGSPALTVAQLNAANSPWRVTLGSARLTIVSWANGVISARVPTNASTGQLEIVRGDTGLRTVHALSVIVGGPATAPTVVQPGQSIQAAIDRTPAGGIVLVPPGTYNEMLVMTRPIQLQSWGADVTLLNATQSPTEKMTEWRKKVNYLANCAHTIGLFSTQGNNVAANGAPCGFTPGTGLFATEEGAGILVAPVSGAFNGTPARIDGFSISGADQSAGIVVNAFARFLEISNNVIENNQGPFAAGIRVGQPALVAADDTIADADNDDVYIHNNRVSENGGLVEPGAGIGLYTGSQRYRVTGNYVCGNFAAGDGGGIAHYGLSDGGLIADNQVLFNQSFDQTVGAGGNGGGILVSGTNPAAGAPGGLTAGSGRVKILRNRIQGNFAGSGDGGGIALRFVNGQDVLASSNANNWFAVDVLNNLIVNNVTALAGGGISLQDALRVAIVNNTIVNNDSTATAANAFVGGQVSDNRSAPQPAGVVARAHSASFAGTPNAGTFSNPRALMNNLIFGNRSKHWEVSAANCPPGPGGATVGCLLNDYYSDLAVLGAGPGATFDNNVQNNVLSQTTTPANTNCGVAGNQCLALNAVPGAGDEALEQTIVQDSYFNSAPGLPGIFQPDGTITAAAENPTLAAAATDEGGNFLDVHYGPLSPVGNYHLNPLPNIAINAGTTPSGGQFPNRSPDYDGQVRPSGTTAALAVFDIGADEIAQGATNTAGGNQAPTFANLPAVTAAFAGSPFVYQVVAADPNADALAYTMTRVPAVLGLNGLSINASTGTVTGTPTNTAILAVYNITVSDGTANASALLSMPVLPGGAIAAVADSYAVTTNGPFTVPARGVLANDLPALTRGTFTAALLTNTATGGSVGLEANGAVTFTPDATFVGSTTFTYEARNLSGQTSAGTVTLSREFTVTDANYIASSNTWRFRGVSSLPNRTLTFVRNRGSLALSGTATTDASGEWSFESIGTPWLAGDAVTVTASGAAVANFVLGPVAVAGLSAATSPLSTAYVQCPGDTNGDSIIDVRDPAHPRAVCRHLAAGDGFARMADGTELYTFGFNDVTGVPANLAIDKGILNAHFPAPTLAFNEGDEVYLTLTNAGMLKRPDLFDPHSVHFHGFPNAATVFDGVPESSVAINMGFSFTYYYSIVEPGTFMYHCHVEAAEHMQMGMLGNLYVRPAQNGSPIGGFTQFVYNDQDGSTGYDVEVPIQIGSFDSNFHILHIGVQPLPFAEMHDDYPMLNGRGYPDTVDPNALPPVAGGDKQTSGVTSAEESSQVVHTRVEATAGQRILLRISNLNVTRFYTLTTTGLPMKVVGTGAHILRGPGGRSLYYDTSSVTLGGGEAVDVLIDTTGVAPGTYLLYSSNLEALSNGNEDFGGMMTEIVIN